MAGCESWYEERPLGEVNSESWGSTLSSVNHRYTPQWTPDGDHIVFTVGEYGATYVAASDGSRVQRISTGSGRYELDFAPDVSPDGTRIVYTTTHHGEISPAGFIGRGIYRNFEIETSALDGSDRRRLTENGEHDHDVAPAWSPDGSRIAFVREGYQAERGIYVMAADGSRARLIVPFRGPDVATGRRTSHAVGPQWSPDGQTLAYVVNEWAWQAIEGLPRNVLYTVRSDGSELRRVAAVVYEYSFTPMGPPAWSPDGQRLAFEMDEGSGSHLYTVRPDGTGLRWVLDGGRASSGVVGEVSWSPDGSEILVTGSRHAVRPDGGGLRRVLPFSDLAAWSPDGSRIAIYNPLLGTRLPSELLATIARDGTDLRIVARREPDVLAPGSRLIERRGELAAGNPPREAVPVDPAPCSTGAVVPAWEANPGLVQDCAALLALRGALAGSADLDWSAETAITGWEGVTVGGSPPRVHEVALWGHGLTGVLPPELGRLSQLVRLELGGNYLSGPVPPELGQLSQLAELYLTGNYLSGPIPPELGQLDQLVVLDLRENYLSGPVPSELGQLRQLGYLDLASNQLSGPIPAELGQLSQLGALTLSGNYLSGPIPPELGQLGSLLWQLELGGNQLSGTIPSEVGAMYGLRTLNLLPHNLSGCVPDGLSDLWVIQSGLERCKPAEGASP